MKTWNAISQSIRDTPQPCLVIAVDGKPDRRCLLVASQAHHVLFSRDVRFEKWLSHPLNAQPACANCNAATKVADNWANAVKHFESLVEAGYGQKLREWLENAPAKLKLDDRWKYYMRELGKVVA